MKKTKFKKIPKLDIRANGINPDEEKGRIFTVFYKEKAIFKKPVIELFLSYVEAYKRYKSLAGKVKARCLMVEYERGTGHNVLHKEGKGV